MKETVKNVVTVITKNKEIIVPAATFVAGVGAGIGATKAYKVIKTKIQLKVFEHKAKKEVIE